jgi:hypothetical protein
MSLNDRLWVKPPPQRCRVEQLAAVIGTITKKCSSHGQRLRIKRPSRAAGSCIHQSRTVSSMPALTPELTVHQKSHGLAQPH